MQIDRQELHDYYAALSDEELLALDRTELTAQAQKYYDEEVAKRRLAPEETERPAEPQDGATLDFNTGDEPDWMENAACAISYTAYPGGSAASDAETAREVLVHDHGARRKPEPCAFDQRTLVGLLVICVHVAPVAGLMPLYARENVLLGQLSQRIWSGNNMTEPEPGQ